MVRIVLYIFVSYFRWRQRLPFRYFRTVLPCFSINHWLIEKRAFLRMYSLCMHCLRARLRARMYVRIYYNVSLAFISLFPAFLCSTTSLLISELGKSFKNIGKKWKIYLVGILKSSTFASAFENGSGVWLTFWQKRSKNPYFFFLNRLVSFETFPFKKKNEKTSENIWKIWNKVLTFAPAFKKEAALIEILFKAGR